MTALQKRDPRSLAQVQHVADAVNRLTRQDLEGYGTWQALADLSNDTSFEGIDVDVDSIVLKDNGSFEAIADVYVHLNYGSANDRKSLGDSYPVTVYGQVDDLSATIDRVEIDTGTADD